MFVQDLPTLDELAEMDEARLGWAYDEEDNPAVITEIDVLAGDSERDTADLNAMDEFDFDEYRANMEIGDRLPEWVQRTWAAAV